MENAADALKMAFAIFVFIMALSITFHLLTQTRETAETILWYADETNYWDYTYEGERIVGVDTVISTLKNRFEQDSLVIILENNLKIIDDAKNVKNVNSYTYGLLPSFDDSVQRYIADHIDKDYLYKETIREITTEGEYLTGKDGVRIALKPEGRTRRYIIFENL